MKVKKKFRDIIYEFGKTPNRIVSFADIPEKEFCGYAYIISSNMMRRKNFFSYMYRVMMTECYIKILTKCISISDFPKQNPLIILSNHAYLNGTLFQSMECLDAELILIMQIMKELYVCIVDDTKFDVSCAKRLNMLRQFGQLDLFPQKNNRLIKTRKAYCDVKIEFG